MDKKHIKVNFSDFWDVFDKNDNFIMDALREYFEVEISDTPDFVFCSIFGRKHLKYECAKIFYTGENIIPDFNLVDYAMGFQDISFYDRYLRLPHYALYDRACSLAKDKHTKDDDFYLNRKFCNYVISNAISAKERGIMIQKLDEYMHLDSGGRYHNNVGGPVADKIDFASNYKFSLAFENSGARGYTTEKIMEAFASATIPIYWGNPDIAEEFNGKSFINCHDFSSFDDVVAKVKEINENDSLYLEMIKSPVFVDGSKGKEVLESDYISGFLYRICSQDPKEAIRRNRIYQGAYYEEEARAHEKIDRILYMPRRFVRGMRNKLKK